MIVTHCTAAIPSTDALQYADTILTLLHSFIKHDQGGDTPIHAVVRAATGLISES